MSIRRLRRWFTSKMVLGTSRFAPWLPESTIDATQWLIGRLGPHMPVLGNMVARNMRAAGVYDLAAFQEYFRQIGLHLANAARIFHHRGDRAEVQRMATEQIGVDTSIAILREAKSTGRGVLLMPAHTVNFVLTLARLNLEVPVCVFLRWSDNQDKLRLKKEWCEACGLQVVMEPAGSLSATSRAAICVDQLRSGSVLAITPDIAQKSTEGTPVRLFDRTAYLPSGSAAIANLADAPIVPLFGRIENGRQILYCNSTIEVGKVSREEGGRKAALQQAMQLWAGKFEAFIRRSPAAWFLWGDSRWTWVFQNDPKYSAPLDSSVAAQQSLAASREPSPPVIAENPS